MPSTPLATIIVPGRDIAAFAPEAIESLQAQTEQRWRAILIDDGSTDATGALFAQAAASDPRFTVVSREISRGLGAARNAGLALVDTPYLGFLDGDDTLAPRALERLLGSLRKSGSDFVVGAYVRSRRVNDDYAPGRIQPWVAASTDPERLGTTIHAHPAASANIVAWSKLSRTDFWQYRRFPEGVAYEDQIVAQEMYTQAGAFDVIPDAVVHWRVREDGSSITQGKGRLPVLRDYLAALGGGIEVLRTAGASGAVTARISLILSMDVPPLEEIAAQHPDPGYAGALEAFLDGLRALPEHASAVPDPTLREALTW